VLFPAEHSVPLSDPSIIRLLPSIDRCVVIESTWQKAGAVYRDERFGIYALPAVHLESYESTYWRYQEMGRQFLSTIEAIFHLASELLNSEKQTGRTDRRDAMQGSNLDDLMYLYALRHQRVHRRYDDTLSPSTSSCTSSSSSAAAGDVGGGVSTARKPKPPPRAWKPN
jgi:tRNA-uridine aminocarboxypropyltransferase